MKRLEINSDKYSTVGACMLFVFSLMGAIGDLLDLVSGRVPPQPHTPFNYLIMLIFSCGLLVALRDRQLRYEYPYGLLAFAFFIIAFTLQMVWSRSHSSLTLRVSDVLGLAASTLAIIEIARWFRVRVGLAKSG